MAHRGKLAVWAMFLYSKQQNSYQGTLELTPIGSRASLGPSLDPTVGWLKITKNGKMKKIPPRYSFCSDTEWKNINRKSIECISTLLKAHQLYKGNFEKIQRKTKDEEKMTI